MKASIFALSLSAGALGAPTLDARQQVSTGTGPYPARWVTAPDFPNHTIYIPQNVDAVNGTMPVVAWGNGACSANGLGQGNFLAEIASWGFIVIASGGPNQGGSTTAQWMKDSIDYATRTTSGPFAKANKESIGVAGWSCGGVEAYEQYQDSRVKTIGIFNSGQMDEGGTRRVVPNIRNKSVFFFLGGPSDIAYNNGMRDYRALPSGIPSWNGNLPVGHGATYGDANGGRFGKAAQLYFRWVLKGDQTAASWFTGNGAQQEGWTVERKDLDKLVFPPQGDTPSKC
ncbi:hypothetical protein M011DRAFT_481552 [Sporormia fimetaria CBS 119925]|uniref:Alpha/beta-hydrolase n=1 Tax=Sporormia fimetaria CBS 119925 TaxID=1340428 RepID=A0A6A6V0C4_9PLEO|nr:hypothetical protein M011DRAFT_481552 [Sporormia fimetaria CBS 119925]